MLKHLLRIFEAFWSILKHFEATWKHFEAFWSIFEAFGSILKHFWSIWKHFEAIVIILKQLWAISQNFQSETSNFPSCKLIIFLFRGFHLPGFWKFSGNQKGDLAPRGSAQPAAHRIRCFWKPSLWPPLEPLEVKLLLGKNMRAFYRPVA